MQRDVPGALAALRETANDNPLVVDLEALLDRGDAFEHIGLAAEMPSLAVDAAEQVDLNLPLAGHSARAIILLSEYEFALSGIVLAAVQPHVEPRGFFGVVIIGKRDGVRLHRAVDSGIVGVNLLFPG